VTTNPNGLPRKTLIAKRAIFNEWRKDEAEAIPELAARVFVLRKRFYMGCGFHWSMEKSLGGVMMQLNDFDRGFEVSNMIVLLVSLEGLYKDVEKAEASADKCDKTGEA